MAIKTGRADKAAVVLIDYDKCTACGLCVKVCKGAPLYMEGNKVFIDQSNFFGCVGCGHCAAVCPVECIRVEGRELSSADMIRLPDSVSRSNYNQLYSLMLSRRSIREFKEREVEQEIIDKIIEAVSTAPMGLPPSDVEILILQGKEKVSEFSRDMINYFKKIKWMFSPPILTIMRPFVSKEVYESFKTFLIPAMDIFIKEKEAGRDWLLYDAPLALYFHVSPYADPVDPFISATYAMLAAESLGLGSCMIGTVGYGVRYSKELKKKYGIPLKNQQGIMIIMGYPDVKYRRGIKRSLAKVSYY